MSNECPPERDVFRYLLKGMGPVEQGAFEAHCASCAECRTRLEGTRRGLELFLDESGRHHRTAVPKVRDAP